jgi:hypothetical protein
MVASPYHISTVVDVAISHKKTMRLGIAQKGRSRVDRYRLSTPMWSKPVFCALEAAAKGQKKEGQDMAGDIDHTPSYARLRRQIELRWETKSIAGLSTRDSEKDYDVPVHTGKYKSWERERERELWQPDNAPKKEEVHLNETLAS